MLANTPAHLVTYLLGNFLLQLQSTDWALPKPRAVSARSTQLHCSRNWVWVTLKYLRPGCAGIKYLVTTDVRHVLSFPDINASGGEISTFSATHT